MCRSEASAPGVRQHPVHEFVLQLEHLVERAVHFGVGQGLATRDIDQAGGHAKMRTVALVITEDHSLCIEFGGDLLQGSVCPARRFEDARPIDDAPTWRCAKPNRQRFGNAGGEPGCISVVGHVHKVQDGDSRHVGLVEFFGRAVWSWVVLLTRCFRPSR